MRLLKYAFWVVLTLAALAVAAVVFARLRAPSQQRAADRAWAESFESMDALRARYASAPDSPAALKLAALALRIGISLRSPASAQAETETFRTFVRFVTDQEMKTDDERLDPAPENIAQVLSRMGSEIDAIESHLLAADPIVWATDIEKGVDAPPVPFLSLRYLGGVLLARALESARTGDRVAAGRSLEASRRLNLTMRERPELIGQLIAISMSLLHNGVVRRIPGPPMVAAGSSTSHDWPASMLRSLQVETLTLSISARQGPVEGASDSGSQRSSLMRKASRLWIDLSIANYSDRMRRLASALRTQDPCASDIEAFAERTLGAVPRWNVLARMAAPGLVRSWSSAGRASLDDELTRMVITAKSRTGPKLTTAPRPSPIPSGVCAGLNFAFRTLPDGDIQVEADRNPFSGETTAPLLAFRVHRADGRAR